MNETISIGRRITGLAQAHPHATALIHARADGTERRATWQELDRRSNQIARMLTARGAGQGSVVAVLLPNSLEHYHCTIGIWKAGATPLPVRWDLPAWERERLLSLADPAVIFVERGSGTAREVDLDGIAATLGLDDGLLPDRISKPMRMIASSGSSGSPKLIVTPSPAVVMPKTVINILIDRMGLGPATVQLVTSPLYHTNGFGSHNGLQRGFTLVLMEKFLPQLAVDLIERHRVNYAVMVPIMLQRMLGLADIGSRDLSSIRSFHCGGSTFPAWVVRRWCELIGPEHVYFAYGGTEGIGVAFCDGREWLEKEGTTGPGIDTSIRIQGPDGSELPTREIGEVFMKRISFDTPTFEYVGVPTPPRTDDGFSTLGDLGWVDEDGYLYIVDRRSDMIVTGGVNVYPAEIEAVLSQHEQVADVIVVGLPDAEWGRRVHAIIQPRDPAAPPGAGTLREYCRDFLASYKVPKTFETVAEIPRTLAGKASRDALTKERTTEEAGSGPS